MNGKTEKYETNLSIETSGKDCRIIKELDEHDMTTGSPTNGDIGKNKGAQTEGSIQKIII